MRTLTRTLTPPQIMADRLARAIATVSLIDESLTESSFATYALTSDLDALIIDTLEDAVHLDPEDEAAMEALAREVQAVHASMVHLDEERPANSHYIEPMLDHAFATLSHAWYAVTNSAPFVSIPVPF